MKKLDTTRYYEVTSLHNMDAYDNSIIGSIVRPHNEGPGESVPGYRNGKYDMIVGKGAYTNYKTPYFFAVTLRPLTKKEQEKIDGSRRDAA